MEYLTRLGHAAAAAAIRPQLDAARMLADVAVSSSCFCRRDGG